MQLVLVESRLVSNEQHQLHVLVVVRNNLDKLREVPAVPFPHAHAEQVDGLVELVKRGNGLDDVVVVLLDAELDLGTRVGVAETKLGPVNIAILELLEELGCVQTEATEEVGDNFVDFGSLALDVGKVRLDATGQVLFLNTDCDLLLLARVRDVELDDGLEVLGANAFGNVVLVLQRLRGTLERRESLDRDKLSKGRQLRGLFLNLLQTVANGISLMLNLENLCAVSDEDYHLGK